VQHERRHPRTQLSHEKRNPLRHEAGDEVDVTAQPIELGDDDSAGELLCLHERLLEHRPPVERISTLAGLDLLMLGHHLEPIGRRKARDQLALRLKPQPALALRARHAHKPPTSFSIKPNGKPPLMRPSKRADRVRLGLRGDDLPWRAGPAARRRRVLNALRYAVDCIDVRVSSPSFAG
jgi:hypothetical protein